MRKYSLFLLGLFLSVTINAQIDTSVNSGACNWNASFSILPTDNFPKEISFTPSPLGQSMHYHWQFDADAPGKASDLTRPVFTYNKEGNYIVTLLITDTVSGCFDSIRQEIHVNGVAADSCTADFGWSTQTIDPGFQTTFTAMSNQEIVSQTWHIFNPNNPQDSISYQIENPVFWALDSATYIVCLFIQTTTGCNQAVCKGVLLQRPPNMDSLNALVLSYPNPAQNEINMKVELDQPGKINIRVYSLTGEPVLSRLSMGTRGSNLIRLPVHQLKTGQYFVEIISGSRRQRSVFQKF